MATSGVHARFEQATNTMERRFRKHGKGLFGDGFGCKCLACFIFESTSVLEAARKIGSDAGVKRGQNVVTLGL